MIVSFPCPTCKVKTTEKSRVTFANTLVHTLECGHIYTTKAGTQTESDRYKALRAGTKSLYDYQVDGAKFLESPGCNFRGLIGDEQGLGKSIQIAAALRFHPELFPVLCICKASLLDQWERVFDEWTDNGILCQVLRTGKDRIVPPDFGVKVYIVSYDNLESHWLGLTAEGINLKLVILDECQLIKNTNTKRTNNVRRFQKVPHIVALSGTSIKNNAVEYFPVLNLLHPEIFSREVDYIRSYVSWYVDGAGITRYGGLSKYNEKYFREKTKAWIIRRTRDEVDVQLPTVNRQTTFWDCESVMRAEYERVMADMIEYCEEHGVTEENYAKHSNSILGYMAKLRRVVGNAKVYGFIEWLSEFRASYPGEKVAIFIHHKEVGDRLERLLKDLKENFIRISDVDSNESRDRKVQQFVNSKGNELLIARTLAEGEGLNLQVCRQAVILEREFNPANEEQAESRFARIGAKHNQINILYPLVKNSIDEWLADLVEHKRDALKSTLDGVRDTYNESSVVKELLKVITERGKRWRLA